MRATPLRVDPLTVPKLPPIMALSSDCMAVAYTVAFTPGLYAESTTVVVYNEQFTPSAATCNLSPVANVLALVVKSIAPDTFTCSRLPISPVVMTYGLASDDVIMVSINTPVLICKELLTVPAGNIVGAKDADVILPLKLPVLICRELLTVPAGITLNPVNAADLLTSASKFTIIDEDTVLSNICKPDIFAVVIGMLE
jgi:hypothetical protein